MSYMRFCVMDVGQGSANYIELRSEMDDSLEAAAIVDIGSEQWKTAAGKPSAEWVADQLKTMTGGAALDTVILSHSDSDHVNLIPWLIKFFSTPSDKKPTLPVLTIKDVVFGGTFAKYRKGKSENFLDQLNDYHPVGKDQILSGLDDNDTSFTADETTWAPLATIGGEIELWMVTANTTAEKIPDDGSKKRKRTELPDGGYATNTRSIVIAAKFAGKTMLATGDATGLTLAHCNEVLGKASVSTKLALPAYMLTLPHHGSDTTTYDLTGSAHGSDAAKKVVRKFSKLVEADIVTGSAGERGTFKHPSATVISDMGAYMLKAPQFIDPALKVSEEHFYTAYFFNRTFNVVDDDDDDIGDHWPIRDWWYTVRSKKNLYTTDYTLNLSTKTALTIAYPYTARAGTIKKFKPMPAEGISWGITVKSNGTTKLSTVVERTAANTEYLAAVEAVHGPLPEGRWVVVESAPLNDGAADEPPPDQPPPAEPEPGPAPRALPLAPPPPAPARLRQLG
jgi:beta-lactamase superfamily II metal-dependent hydrolase